VSVAPAALPSAASSSVYSNGQEDPRLATTTATTAIFAATAAAAYGHDSTDHHAPYASHTVYEVSSPDGCSPQKHNHAAGVEQDVVPWEEDADDSGSDYVLMPAAADEHDDGLMPAAAAEHDDGLMPAADDEHEDTDQDDDVNDSDDEDEEDVAKAVLVEVRRRYPALATVLASLLMSTCSETELIRVAAGGRPQLVDEAVARAVGNLLEEREALTSRIQALEAAVLAHRMEVVTAAHRDEAAAGAAAAAAAGMRPPGDDQYTLHDLLGLHKHGLSGSGAANGQRSAYASQRQGSDFALGGVPSSGQVSTEASELTFAHQLMSGSSAAGPASSSHGIHNSTCSLPSISAHRHSMQSGPGGMDLSGHAMGSVSAGASAMSTHEPGSNPGSPTGRRDGSGAAVAAAFFGGAGASARGSMDLTGTGYSSPRVHSGRFPSLSRLGSKSRAHEGAGSVTGVPSSGGGASALGSPGSASGPGAGHAPDEDVSMCGMRASKVCRIQ